MPEYLMCPYLIRVFSAYVYRCDSPVTVPGRDMCPCLCSGRRQVLAMSSRSWLNYYYQSRFHLTPLSYQSLEYASGFASEQCPEGIVAISTNTLRILALEKLGAVFNQVRRGG